MTSPVFISYRHEPEGSEIAVRLAGLLRSAGLSVWIDIDDMPPGSFRNRIEEALDSGISGGIIVATPGVAESETIKAMEAPKLIELHSQKDAEFTLAVVNPQSPKYHVPDELLGLSKNTLNDIQQYGSDQESLLRLVEGMARRRISLLRERITTGDNTFRLSLQTRNRPNAHDVTGDELDIRIGPSTQTRLPGVSGLQNLKETITFLPDLVTQSGADRVRVRGGAHLSVAFAIGAALPSTRFRNLEVEQGNDSWSSQRQIHNAKTSAVRVIVGQEPLHHNATTPGPRVVAAYVDLLSPRSDEAFTRYCKERGSSLLASRHLTRISESDIDPAAGGEIAADITTHIRKLSADYGNAQVDLLLRCPFPLALLIGRLTNTLQLVLYEWENSDYSQGPRYVPTLRVNPGASGGVIEEVLLSDPC